MPFKNESLVPDFIECKQDIIKVEKLCYLHVKLTESLTFLDRELPPSTFDFTESDDFTRQYFVNLHENVKKFGVHNYRGARIPLKHNNIKVEELRSLLFRFNYQDIHILQFIEFGFSLGLW